MAGRSLFALVVLFAFIHCCFSETVEENDEISKRALESAARVYSRLKSSFLSLPSKPIKPGIQKFGGKFIQFQQQHPFHKVHDVVFIMDESGSVGRRHFETAKQFVGDMILSLPVSYYGTRVAVVKYSTRVKLQFNFWRHSHPQCAKLAVDNLSYDGGATATGAALQYVHRRLLFNSWAGARSYAEKFVFLLTDGRSNYGKPSRPSIPAKLLKWSGATIFVMGIGYRVNQKELVSIATSPLHVFRLESFFVLKALNTYLERDNKQKCRFGRCSLVVCRKVRKSPREAIPIGHKFPLQVPLEDDENLEDLMPEDKKLFEDEEQVEPMEVDPEQVTDDEMHGTPV